MYKNNAEKCSLTRKHLARKDKRLSALFCCFMKRTNDVDHYFQNLHLNKRNYLFKVYCVKIVSNRPLKRKTSINSLKQIYETGVLLLCWEFRQHFHTCFYRCAQTQTVHQGAEFHLIQCQHCSLRGCRLSADQHNRLSLFFISTFNFTNNKN